MSEYTRHTWKDGEVIDAQKLNNIEKGIAEAREKANKHASQHAADGTDPITPEQIGAAPAGYGLGESPVRITSVAQLDNFSENGWYRCKFPSAIGLNNIWFLEGNLHVTRTGDDNWTQEIYPAGHASPIVRNCQSAWKGEWESANPTMVKGEEYRTTDRWIGEPVYKKLVSLGTLPSNNVKTFTNLLPSNVRGVITYRLIGYSAGDAHDLTQHCYFNSTHNGLTIRQVGDLSMHTGEVYFEYIKG